MNQPASVLVVEDITKPVLLDELEQVLQRFAEYWTNAVELPSSVFNLPS